MGGLLDCLAAGSSWVASNQSRVVKIFKLRNDQKKSPVIAEITIDGIRWITNGRQISIKSLMG